MAIIGDLRSHNQSNSVTLLASAARTSTGTATDSYMLPPSPSGITFVLDVTAAATDSGDTLDVYVQTAVGDLWLDVGHFTQCLGNGGTKKHFLKISATEPQAAFENASALSAGSVRHLIGDSWRVRWDITDASTQNASFSFSVTATPI